MQDETEWRDVPEFPLYEISSAGLIRNRRTLRTLKGGVVQPSGYILVTLRRDNINHNVYPHILACTVFHTKPSAKATVIHKNANRYDNRPENLKWKSI